MKLYDVPRNTLVRVLPEVHDISDEMDSIFEKVKVPPGAPAIQINEYIQFSHVDGMYSCGQNMEGEIVHMAAWTEVEPVVWSYENMALLRTIIKRGGRGKDGTESVKWVRTDDMNDEWLAACVTYEEELRPTNKMIEFYKWEQKYREEHGITIT